MGRVARRRRQHQLGVAGEFDVALAVAVVAQRDAAQLGIVVGSDRDFGGGLDVAVAAA